MNRVDEAYSLNNYLPLLYRNNLEQDYISYLWDSFQANLDENNYPFAYLAFHMLMMCFVYFIVWKIRNILPDDFFKALIGFRKDIETELLNATSPFTFCVVSEKRMFRFLKLIECQNSNIGKYIKLVEDRDNIAHSNGNIFFRSPDTFEEKIEEVLRCVNEIQEYFDKILVNHYAQFLRENWNLDDRQYLQADELIREQFIRGNYISEMDITHCIIFDIKGMEAEPNFNEIRELNDTFVSMFSTS